MAVIATQTITGTGAALGAPSAASGGGDQAQPAPGAVLQVINLGASPCTVTIDSKVPSNYGSDVDLGGTVPAGQQAYFPLNDARRLGDPADGLADITYSQVTSVFVTVLKAPDA